MSEGISIIVHHDRHGNTKEERRFSVPVTSDEGDSDALAMSQMGVTNIANALQDNINAESSERESVNNDLQQHKEDSNAHSDIRSNVDLLSDTVNNHTVSINSLQNGMEHLQEQIDEIIGGSSVVSLSASPLVVYAGESVSVVLTATCNPSATSIHLVGNGVDAMLGSGTRQTYTHQFSLDSAGSVSYEATFNVSGTTKKATRSISAAFPIYYGAGANYNAATTKASARTSPAGTYTINIGTRGHKVFFLVPTNMSIKTSTMGGFEFPLSQTENVTKDGRQYKCYESEGMNVDILDITLA